MPDINASHLPEKPDLGQERERAKDLLRALRTGDGEAIARFRSHHPRFADLTADTLRPTDVQLGDAQWVIAREYGFPSWPALKAHIEQVSAGSTTVAPSYSVLMWNDNDTPMEFVCYLLETVFELDAEKAKQIMLDTHNRGVGVCGVYDRQQDAEAKVAAATTLAREHGHPLRLTHTYGSAGKRRERAPLSRRSGPPTRPTMASCYCLIPDARGKCVLAVSAGERLWTLPTVEHDDQWFAHASTAVARRATWRYGIPITALREHTIADCRVCELEIQTPQWTPPAGTRWIASSDLAAMTLEPAALSTLLRTWFFERESGALPSVRPAWERPGWYAEAVRWILSECTRLGYAPSGPIEQLKAAWSLSSILRVNSSVGSLYFKADWARPPSEPAVIDALARRWPRNVPAVVAADHDRGWMLMRDFGGRSLDGEPIARWQAANRTFATIQVACSADLEPWWRLGCPDLRIPILAAYMDRLLGDDAALRIDERDGLTTAAATRLRELVPRLHDLWDELAAIPIPASIVQQDFRHGNLVMSGRSYVFYDWSDTVISHPFFACCRFLDFVQRGPHPRRGLPVKERCRRIADAYLQPWTNILGHADLQRAFELARRLNPIYVAIRWYLDAPYCEPTSSWGRVMREAPARELRRWLARMDEMASGP